MDPVTAAYVAAMIDGEGVITLGKQRSTGKDREFTYRPRLMVTNSHEGLIRFMREVTGFGHVYRSKAQREGWSEMLRWQVTNAACIGLLGDLRDYLVVKRRQADLLLAMPRMPRGQRGEHVEAIYAEQVRTFDTIAALNKRGPKNDPALTEFPSDHPAFGRQDRVVGRQS